MSLNVALLNDSFPPAIDGVANAVVNYAENIHKKYGTPTVITPKYPHIIDNYPYEVFRYSSAKMTVKMPFRVGNPFSPILLNELRPKNFDLLHVHSPFASSVLAREISIQRKGQIPTILTYHTKFNIDIDKYVKFTGFNKIAKSFMLNNINTADEVWTVSKGTIENLREIGYEGEIIVMPNGTDFVRGKSSIEEIEEINRMHCLTDEFVMLFVGRMMWYKNLEIILDSLKNLSDAGIKFKAFFVGEGPDRFSVEHYAKSLGIYDRTIFTGAIYDRKKVKAYFSRADLFLFPSTFDTSGLVVKEAAACGCPSILTKGSCAAEDVEDGVSGILSNENSEEFTKHIVDYINSTDLQNKLKAGASEKLYRSWDSCVDLAVQRYYTVIENHKHAPRKKPNYKLF